MGGSGCIEAVELLNLVFGTPLVLNDGHEILARLSAGDEVADLVDDYARKFGRAETAQEIRQVTENWPPLHMEAASQLVQWALGKLDTDDRVTINWKGDAEHPETVTKFELRDHTLLIEFAHPPGGLRAPGVSA
jgi:hypothetical protein